MSGRPIRFLQAGDFHLERPLGGLPVVPDHLRDALVDAPFEAAAQVFAHALAEEVDFVLLAGGIVSAAEADARTIAFLLQQFDHLAQREIAVYWLDDDGHGGASWPGEVALPENVRLFSGNRGDQTEHQRDGEPLATIFAQGRSSGNLQAADLRAANAKLFSIAVAHGKPGSALLEAAPINYWAWGGSQQRKTVATSPSTAHYAGSPQGRGRDDCGAHGCTLVRVDETGRARTRLLTTDVVRWCQETISVSAETTLETLRQQMCQRAEELADDERHLLITWQIAGDGALPAMLRRGSSADELLHSLRQQFGFAAPAAWSVSLSAPPPAALLPQLYEEDTILGDFLRAAVERQADDAEPLSLDDYLTSTPYGAALADAADLSQNDVRRRVLHEAQVLAADLLQGSQETQP